MIPGSGSKSATLNPTDRLLLPEEDDGGWLGDVRGLARRPKLKSSLLVVKTNVNSKRRQF